MTIYSKYSHKQTRRGSENTALWLVESVGDVLLIRFTWGQCCVTLIQRWLAGFSPFHHCPPAACQSLQWCQPPTHLAPLGNKPPENDPPHSWSGAWTPAIVKYIKQILKSVPDDVKNLQKIMDREQTALWRWYMIEIRSWQNGNLRLCFVCVRR